MQYAADSGNPDPNTTPADDRYEQARHVTTSIVGELVKQHPGSTSRELAQISGKCRMQIARRLPEAMNLKTNPTVKQGHTRPCSVSGRIALTWWPTENRS